MIFQLARLTSDADAQSRKLDGAQLLDHRLQPVVSAGRSARPQPQAPQRQVRIVHDNEHIRGRELVKAGDLANGQPLKFMKVVGSASNTPSPMSGIFATRAFQLPRSFNVT